MKCPNCTGEAWINKGKLPMSVEHRWRCSKCGHELIGQKHRFIKSDNSSKWLFQTGSPKDLKLMECPGCHEYSCHWIGGSPKDIECLNKSCVYFKLPPKSPNTITTLKGIFRSSGVNKNGDDFSKVRLKGIKFKDIEVGKDAIRKAVKKMVDETFSLPYHVPPGPVPEITLEDLTDIKPKENWGDK